MAQPRDVSGSTKDGAGRSARKRKKKPRAIRVDNFVLLGLELGALYWAGEAAVHAFLLKDATFVQQVFRPNPHELWMRWLVVWLLFCFGIYTQFTIDRRRRVERALQKERDFASAVLDTVGALVVVLDRQGRIVRFNRTCEQVTGFTFDEVTGKPIWDILLPTADRQRLTEIFDELQKGISPDTYEGRWATRQGGTRLIAWTHTAIRNDQGDVEYVIGGGLDITERRQVEEALRESERRFRELADLLPDMIYETDERLRLTYANRKALALLGISYGDIARGMHLRDFLTEASQARADEAVARLRENGGASIDVYEIRRSDGAPVFCEANSVAIRGSDEGGFHGIRGVLRDITERRRYEDDLRRSNEELEQFAYVASHDLQEPLRMISTYLQLLERRYKGQLDSDADEFIDYAVDGATRMHTLINDLLTYSRVGTRGGSFEPTSAEEALSEAVSNLRALIDESQATVTHDNLPTIIADGSQITQLLQNLIGNAIKFRSEDPPGVHVSAEVRGDEWVFAVKDNGIGIDPKYADRIFVIFQRLHNRREYSGTGIGLAVCKKIVERHGGRIWVESEQGQGATFLFTLPRFRS